MSDRRSLNIVAKMAAAVMAQLTGRDQERYRYRVNRYLQKIAGGGRRMGKTYRPNGKRECERRRRQKAAGTLTRNYVHGEQYRT